MVASSSRQRGKDSSHSRRRSRSRSGSLPVHYRKIRRDRNSPKEKSSKRARSPAGRSPTPPHSARRLQNGSSHHYGDAKYHKSQRRSDDGRKSHSDERHSPSFSPRAVKSTAFRVENKVESYSNGCQRTRIAGISILPYPTKCLGVFGMNRDTTQRYLFKLFKNYGYIDHMAVSRYPDTGASRGIAFIYYSKIEEAERARRQFDRTFIDGRQVRIEFIPERR